ncbi:hypothetical protein BDZ89DRAFT_1146605 [Hymenopellis radicata]|nr:hypothetical protein BDZ89DRAFT_1146605 [Hymenopellis radicata]
MPSSRVSPEVQATVYSTDRTTAIRSGHLEQEHVDARTAVWIFFTSPPTTNTSRQYVICTTTLINTLFCAELSPPKNSPKRHHKQLDKLTEVEIIKAELEEKQFKPNVELIDDQHEAYMRQEQQPQRYEKTDLRVHACLNRRRCYSFCVLFLFGDASLWDA